jgi:hypothetical protein
MNREADSMMRRMWCVGLLLVCMAGTAVAGDMMFAHKFEQGKSQRYRLQLNTEMEMTGMEASQTADMTVKVTCSAKAKDKYTMTVLFEKVTASNMIAGNLQEDPSAAQMMGKTVIFTVDAHGSVSDIRPGPGFDVWESVQQVVEPTIKNWYVYMPGKAVAVGGEWKRENFHDKTTAGADYVTNEKFKFREIKKVKGGELAVVDEDVTTTVGGTTETPIGVFKLAGTGTGKFEFWYDPARGTVPHFKGTMNTSIDMTPQSGSATMKTTVANHIERDLIE